MEILSKWKDKSPEEVLKAKVEADLHIKAIEREKAELKEMYLAQRDELLAKAKFEDYLDQIKTPPQSLQAPLPQANEVNSPTFDRDEFKKLANDTYQEFDRTKREAENFRQVETKLKDKFGDNYANVLKDQQIQLGLSSDEVNSLAKRSPEAFSRLMGLDTKTEGFQAPMRSGQTASKFSPTGEPKRGMSYYQELKKTDPRVYLDPKISQQMERDALNMGEAFFNS